MELVTMALKWVTWLGVGGAIGIVALLFFAPAIGQVVAAAVTPMAKAAGEGVVWFFRDILWEGFKDATDNLATILFLLTAILVGGWLISDNRPCKVDKTTCEKCVQDLRRDYKFVPRTPAEKKAYKRTAGESQWFEFWK